MQKHRLALYLLLMVFSMASTQLLAQPANDNCVDAIAIGEVTDLAFSSLMANTDGPNHVNDCQSGGTTPDSVYNDIWYAYTATFTGFAEWTLCNTADFDTKIIVYNAGASCPLMDGDIYDCSEDGVGCGTTSAVTFAVTSGETYILRLGGYGDGSPGEEGAGTFTVAETDPPPMGPENDACENSIVVMLGDDQAFDNTNADTDGPEHPTAPCFAFGNDFVNQDVWYTFTAPNTATIEWATCNLTGWDTRMAVYNAGTTCPLEDADLLACNDDGAGCNQFTSYMTFPVEAGETYLLRLGGYAAADFGSGIFNLREIIPPDPPANDVCTTSAIEVFPVTLDQANLGEGINNGTTSFGTQDAGVPPCLNNGELFDVWYTFNSGLDTTFNLRFNIVTDTAAFIFEFYDACDMPTPDTSMMDGTLTTSCITIDEGSGLFMDTITGFPGVPTEYYIRISTVVTFNSPGEFWFQLIGENADSVIVNTNELFSNDEIRFFPNPTQDFSQIEFSLDQSAKVGIEVMNALGEVVRREEQGTLSSGAHQIGLNTSPLSNGIYFLRITADGEQRVLKFMVL